MSIPCLRTTDAGVEVSLFVQPRASRNKLVGILNDELKVALTAPPVDGAANKACCAFLAKLCGVPKSRVTIVAGETSRHKRLLLAGVESDAVARIFSDALGVDIAG